MKELTSSHNDLDKRLAIFFGLGALVMSALVGLIRGYTLEGFLLQGVVVLTLATLAGWLFGLWVQAAWAASAPKEELPSNVERRSSRPENLAEGSVVLPSPGAESVISEELHEPLPGAAMNYVLPEFSPADLAHLTATADAGEIQSLVGPGAIPVPIQSTATRK